MVPEIFTFLDELPITPNGKIDRRALPSVEEFNLNREVYVAPRNDTERTLCQLWQELLSVEQIGINDNFFSLGGHSLLATRLISAVRHKFEMEIPLAALFESPTVAGLAEMMAMRQDDFVIPEITSASSFEEDETDVEDFEF